MRRAAGTHLLQGCQNQGISAAERDGMYEKQGQQTKCELRHSNLSYLESGSFLVTEHSKSLEKNTVPLIFYIVNLQTLVLSTNMVHIGIKFLILKIGN